MKIVIKNNSINKKRKSFYDKMSYKRGAGLEKSVFKC